VQRIANEFGIAAFGSDPSNGDVLIADNDSDRILRLIVAPSANANLANLALSSGVLMPAFASGTLSYAASVSHNVSAITVTPTVADATATVTVNGVAVASGTASDNIALAVGDNSLTTVVTAQNGTSTQTYTVTATRQSSIESWRQEHFGISTNTGIAADTATPDHDGIANLIKYALAITPGSCGSNFLPAVQTNAYPEGRRLRLVFRRDPARDDVTIAVEASDMVAGSWMPVATSVNGAPFSGAGYVGETDLGNGLRAVEVRDVVNVGDAPLRFMRVTVTR
jgi:hypothetical protein